MTVKIARTNKVFQRIKEIQKGHDPDGLIFVDDLSVLSLANRYQLEIDSFIYCDELEYHDDTKKLIEVLESKSKESYTISKSTFDSIKQKGNSAGLMAVIKNNIVSLDKLKKHDYLVVCDHLEIPGNLGTIYRTMDSADVHGMILVDSITKPTNPKLTSSARGCNLLIDTANTSYNEALEWLLENNYTIYLGEPNLGKSYKDYNYNGKIAIVVGNERFGINPDWYNHKHEKVFIPMFGSNNSLNVGVAASILIYEATMNRKNEH